MVRTATIAVSALIASILFWHHANAVTYWVAGQGIDSCGTWSANKPPPTTDEDDSSKIGRELAHGIARQEHFAWVQGYLSGISHERASVSSALGKTDGAAQEAWIDDYCTSHPLATLAKAAEALTLELEHRH
jgi:hypothetical protein